MQVWIDQLSGRVKLHHGRQSVARFTAAEHVRWLGLSWRSWKQEAEDRRTGASTGCAWVPAAGQDGRETFEHDRVTWRRQQLDQLAQPCSSIGCAASTCWPVGLPAPASHTESPATACWKPATPSSSLQPNGWQVLAAKRAGPAPPAQAGQVRLPAPPTWATCPRAFDELGPLSRIIAERLLRYIVVRRQSASGVGQLCQPHGNPPPRLNGPRTVSPSFVDILALLQHRRPATRPPRRRTSLNCTLPYSAANIADSAASPTARSMPS